MKSHRTLSLNSTHVRCNTREQISQDGATFFSFIFTWKSFIFQKSIHKLSAETQFSNICGSNLSNFFELGNFAIQISEKNFIRRILSFKYCKSIWKHWVHHRILQIHSQYSHKIVKFVNFIFKIFKKLEYLWFEYCKSGKFLKYHYIDLNQANIFKQF